MKKSGMLALLLCLCLLFCSCDGGTISDTPENTDEAQASKQKLYLLYNETDTFNPYSATTKENREICQLLFDSLVTLGTDFEPIYKIADSVVLDGKTCTVKIKSVLHSDNTHLTAADVVYSALLAKDSETIYASQFENVKNVSAFDDKTIVFELYKADPFFCNLLDFPIIKQNSENRKSEDNIVLPPIGSGRYVLNEKSETLSPNLVYYGEAATITEISLINAPGAESIEHYVSSGVVSFCYSDFGDNKVPQMSGLKANVPLNNMVFIGINMSNGKLSNQYLRYAISSAVDRNKIVDEAYFGNGTAATGPFNPLWKHGEGFQTLEKNSNTQISVVNLEKIGYNSIDNGGYRVDSNGKHITLRLLVNSDNTARMAAAGLIVDQLKKVGIEVIIDAQSYDNYLKKLQSRSFDLYIGEVRLLNNMDLTELVTPGGSAAFGIKAAAPTTDEDGEPTAPDAQVEGITLTSAQAVAGYYNGQYTIGDVASAFLSEMPLVPLFYRSGIAMFTPAMTEVPQVSQSDLFIDINNYTFK